MTGPKPTSQPPAPCLVVADGPAAIDFYKAAFGAEETFRMMSPDGRRVLHANLVVNGGPVMLSDDFPEYNGGRSRDPKGLGGTPVTIHLQVADADAVFARALEAGCTAVMPLADMFWGDRYGKILDPFGHEWSIATTIATPTREEMDAAVQSLFGPGGCQ